LDTIMGDPENRDAVAILVSLRTESKKAVRLNITLPEDVLKDIDAYAQAHGLTRSGFLARAAKHEISAAAP
ncbi:type II toxin-antitoxin system HicB family antitoxin, partial [Klebsiella pneumoniae]